MKPGVKRAVMAAIKPGTAYSAVTLARQLGLLRAQVQQVLNRAVIAGDLAERRIAGVRAFFATQACADLFGEAAARELMREQAERRDARRRQLYAATVAARQCKRYQVVPAKPGVPAPVTVRAARQAAAEAEADYSRARVTRCAPTTDHRYQARAEDITPGAWVEPLPAGRWSEYVLARRP